MIDVAVYTQQALEATARIAGMLGEPDCGGRYEQLASQLKTRINQKFWLEERDVVRAISTARRLQAINAAEGAIKQIGLKGVEPS